jgi:polyisoprenoid-binding protein YceI
MRHIGLLLPLLLIAGVAGAEPVRYSLDPTHTFVTFEARPLDLSTIRGRFDRKEGSIEIDRAAKTGRVEITIDTRSVSTGIAEIDQALKGKDGLDTEAFGSATFLGEAFRFDGDKVSAVTGTLTLLGQTAPLELRAVRYNCYTNPLLRREVCGGDFEATLDRTRFGINALLPSVPDSIHLLVQVEAIRQP